MVSYQRAIKKGFRGTDVKELQSGLNSLGYDCGLPDGIAGVKTDIAIRSFQRNNNLLVDGWAGRATIDKVNGLLGSNIPSVPKKSSYYKSYNAFIMEVDPLKLYVDVVKKKGSVISGDFINGTLFYNGSSQIAISTIVKDGKVIAEHAPHDNVKRGTLVIYKNGTVSMEMIDFISKHKKLADIKCAIGGFNIMPGITMREQFKKEWFDYATVGYRTWRSMLGYSKAKNKILVVIAPNIDAQQGSVLMKKLGCDLAVGLDGGGSTCGRFSGVRIRSTTRVIHNIVRWN